MILSEVQSGRVSGKMVGYLSPSFESLSCIQTDPSFISQETSTTGDLQNDLGHCFQVRLTPEAILRTPRVRQVAGFRQLRAHGGHDRGKAQRRHLIKSSRRRPPCACAHIEESQLRSLEVRSSEVRIAQIQNMIAKRYVYFFELLAGYSSKFFRSRSYTFNGVRKLSIANEKEGHSVGWNKLMVQSSQTII